MSRYIDIETINPRTYESSEVELGVLAYDYDEICAMPFLDIVWCGDCKWGSREQIRESVYCEWVCNRMSRMMGFNVVVKADDYCSYGEREETE